MTAPVRLQRYLAAAGVAARRKAEELITAGRVTVNGEIVRVLGTKIDPQNDAVAVDGEAVAALDHFYVLFNKPKGCITAVSDDRGRPTVMDYLPNVPVPVKPVGRLDFYTEGVLLLTNDGELAARLLAPASHVPKTYHVKIHGQLEPEHLRQLREGVTLDDGTVTMPAEIEKLPGESKHTWLAITIHEGKHRQIHRMIEALGFFVDKLQRVAFASLTFHGLRVGDARELTQQELNELRDTVGLDHTAVARGRWRAKREATDIPRRARAKAREEAGLPEPAGDDDFDRDEGGAPPSAHAEPSPRDSERGPRASGGARGFGSRSGSRDGGGRDSGPRGNGSNAGGRDGGARSFGSKTSGRDDRGPRGFGSRTGGSDDRGARSYGPKTGGRDDRGPRSFGSKTSGRDGGGYGSKPGGRDRGPRGFGPKTGGRDGGGYGSKPGGRDSSARSYGSKTGGSDDRGARSFGPKTGGRDDRGARSYGSKTGGSDDRGARSFGPKTGGRDGGGYGSKPGGRDSSARGFGSRTGGRDGGGYGTKPGGRASNGRGFGSKAGGRERDLGSAGGTDSRGSRRERPARGGQGRTFGKRAPRR